MSEYTVMSEQRGYAQFMRFIEEDNWHTLLQPPLLSLPSLALLRIFLLLLVVIQRHPSCPVPMRRRPLFFDLGNRHFLLRTFALGQWQADAAPALEEPLRPFRSARGGGVAPV
jgi:hypothetical protein